MNLSARLLPVTATFSALTITTKSPVSMCGAYIGLCLPRSSVAAWAASLPSTTSVASITCQAWVMSPGFGLYVDTDLPRCCRLPERHPGVRSNGVWCAGAAGTPGDRAARSFHPLHVEERGYPPV